MHIDEGEDRQNECLFLLHTLWNLICKVLYNHDQQIFENNLILNKKSYPIENEWLWSVWGQKTKQMFMLIINQ